MGFKEFLVESSSKREQTAIANFRKKVTDKLDSVAGNEVKERAFGKSIAKEIHKKYYEFFDYLFDNILANTTDQLKAAKSWAALEGASEFFDSIDKNDLAKSFKKDAEAIDKSAKVETGSADKVKAILDLIKRKSNDISAYLVHSPFEEVTFPSTRSQTITVKESVKVAAANLYFQHKTKYFKRVSTTSSKAELIIYAGGHKDGQIQHVIYDDNGETKIVSFGAYDLVTDALEGTFNNKTLTKV